jgi:diguanylate cyclase (GGDEF)-like protein
MKKKQVNNIVLRIFDFMARKVCFTFAVYFISFLGASAAVPGIILIWATIPYEDPSFFRSEVIMSFILLFICALIHAFLYGFARLWGKRWELPGLRVLNDNLKSSRIPPDISTATLKEISHLLERLPGMNFWLSMILSLMLVIVVTWNNYIGLGNRLYAIYVFRGASVATITYIMFTYIISELTTLNLRRRARLILADREAWEGTGYSSTLSIKFIFIIILMITSMVITQGLASTKVVHSAFVTFLLFTTLNVIVGMFMCLLIFVSIMITLREIEEATSRLGEQQNARFISGSLDREFVNTSMGLYRAGQKIVKFQNDLQDLNQTLEQKVDERTEQIKILMMTDPLTGSYNRRYLMENLPKSIKKAERYKRSISLVMCDLDHFKKVNDNYGHQAGDQVLIAFVGFIRGAIRNEIDWVARYGGEEFVIVLPETDANGAWIFAERLRKDIAGKVIESDGKEIRITASFGTTGFNSAESAAVISADVLISKADDGLYQAKDQGRNRVVANRVN